MLMHLTFTLAFAGFALNAAGSTDQPVAGEPPRIQVGDTTFTAEKVLFASADGAQPGRFRCTLEGHAKLILFAGDIEFTADKIQFELDGESPVSIICTGSCRYKEADDGMILSGDKLNFRFGDQGAISVTGNANLQYGSGQYKTALSGESIIRSRDGVFEVLGKARLRLGR